MPVIRQFGTHRLPGAGCILPDRDDDRAGRLVHCPDDVEALGTEVGMRRRRPSRPFGTRSWRLRTTSSRMFDRRESWGDDFVGDTPRVTSPQALAGILDPLIATPALVALVYLALWLRNRGYAEDLEGERAELAGETPAPPILDRLSAPPSPRTRP